MSKTNLDGLHTMDHKGLTYFMVAGRDEEDNLTHTMITSPSDVEIIKELEKHDIGDYEPILTAIHTRQPGVYGFMIDVDQYKRSVAEQTHSRVIGFKDHSMKVEVEKAKRPEGGVYIVTELLDEPARVIYLTDHGLKKPANALERLGE